MEPPEKPSERRRHVPGEIAAAERVQSSVEVSLGLTPVAAMEETSRCLRCDIRSAERLGRIRLDPEGEGPHRRRVRSRPAPARAILEVARASNKYIPALCYMEGLTRGRRVPAVHGRGRRASSRLLPACTTPVAGRHGGHHHLAAARVLPQDRARAALLRAEPRLRGVRVERALRAAGARAGARGDARALPLQLPAPARSTPRTRASSSTTTAACSARAACGPAPRSRARTCGTSPPAASSRGW